MKIYFSGAIFQKNQFGEHYRRIVRILEKYGHEVYQDTTEVSLRDAINKTDEERVAYYRKVIKWISESDAVVLEVSFPSTLHIGHEISIALEKGKPVIALYHKHYEPSFFLGLEDKRLFWVEYEADSLDSKLSHALDKVSEERDMRFNFFIPRRLVVYLDWVSRRRRVPRAVYLRQLLRTEMERNKDYLQ